MMKSCCLINRGTTFFANFLTDCNFVNVNKTLRLHTLKLPVRPKQNPFPKKTFFRYVIHIA